MLQQTLENFALFSFFFFLYFIIRIVWDRFAFGIFSSDEKQKNSMEFKKDRFSQYRWNVHTGEIDHKSKKWNSVEDFNSHHGLVK